MAIIRLHTKRQTVLLSKSKQEFIQNKNNYQPSGSKFTSSFLAVAKAEYKRTVTYQVEKFVAD